MNLEKDNRTELNKIFLIYSHLDMQETAQEVYLDYMINQQALNIAGSYRPVIIEERDLSELQRFMFDEFLPQATDLIAKEVRIGVPSGRIFDIMGTELRFMTSFRLIQRFLEEYYRPMIKKIISKDALLSKPDG